MNAIELMTTQLDQAECETIAAQLDYDDMTLQSVFKIAKQSALNKISSLIKGDVRLQWECEQEFGDDGNYYDTYRIHLEHEDSEKVLTLENELASALEEDEEQIEAFGNIFGNENIIEEDGVTEEAEKAYDKVYSAAYFLAMYSNAEGQMIYIEPTPS